MMETLHVQQPLYIPTGRTGQERHAVKQVLQYSLEQGRITLCEMLRLQDLVESPDAENLTVAMSILEAKHHVKFV